MMKVWKLGDAVVVLNDENVKIAEGTICDIEHFEGVGTVEGADAYYINGENRLDGTVTHDGPFWENDLMTPDEYAAMDTQPLMLDTVMAKRCEDGTVWVTSDLNPNGVEVHFEEVTPSRDERQFLYAIAEFLGFDPDSVLCFDDNYEGN